MNFDRRHRLLQQLNDQQTLSLREARALFPDVSEMTLRRDFDYLESIGEAVRIRGGVRRTGGSGRQEDTYSQRLTVNPTAKAQIARLAAAYIETGRSLFLDSGSTVYQLAKLMPDAGLSVLTSSPDIALEMSDKVAPAVTLIGGLLNRESRSVSGLQSLEFVSALNIDLAFLVPSAFSVENGFSCGNHSECELKRRVIAKAKRVILLADSDKYGKSMPYTFARLDDVDVLITDRAPDDSLRAAAQAAGVTVQWGENQKLTV